MRRALVRSTPAVLALAVAATLGACADDVEPGAPTESLSPRALETTAPAEGSGPTEPPDSSAIPDRTEDLQRPGSWPAGMEWTPVRGEVEDYLTVDGSVRLVVRADDTDDPKALVDRLVEEFEESAHAVSATDDWSSGQGESVIVAQHPEQVIETRVEREGTKEPLVVEIVLTPLGG